MDLKKPSRVAEGEVNFSQGWQLKRLKRLNGCWRKKCIPYGHKSTAEERLWLNGKWEQTSEQMLPEALGFTQNLA